MVPKLGCSKSRDLAMVLAQRSTKALATFHECDGATSQYLGRDQSIPEPLVISFTVVVRNILGDDLAQGVPFAKRDHLTQALLPNRSNEALCKGVQVWATRRQPDGSYTGGLQYL